MRHPEIRNHPRHVSTKHPPMSMTARAAQFSSFKALSGFEDEIDETARLVDSRKELTEDELTELNQSMQLLSEIGAEHPFISVTYFKPDLKKNGGSYVSVKGHFRIIDIGVRMIKFTDGTEVPIDDIYSVKFINLKI